MSDVATVRAALRAQYDRLEKASRDGDIAAATRAVYAPDVITAGQDSPTVKASEALIQVLEGLIGGGARLKITPMFDGPRLDGDLAYDFVLNEVDLPGGTEQLVGKSLMVWKRRADGWQCVADMFAMGNY